MNKLILQVDGIRWGLQAPGASDEDTNGGCAHGDASMNWIVENLNEASGFLLGRRTFEGFANH